MKLELRNAFCPAPFCVTNIFLSELVLDFFNRFILKILVLAHAFLLSLPPEFFASFHSRLTRAGAKPQGSSLLQQQPTPAPYSAYNRAGASISVRPNPTPVIHPVGNPGGRKAPGTSKAAAVVGEGPLPEGLEEIMGTLATINYRCSLFLRRWSGYTVFALAKGHTCEELFALLLSGFPIGHTIFWCLIGSLTFIFRRKKINTGILDFCAENLPPVQEEC